MTDAGCFFHAQKGCEIMIEVIGLQLYQWDIGRKVRIKPDEGMKVQKVNFTNQSMESASVADTIEDGEYVLAYIPNELLKQSKNVVCYAIMVNSDGEQTIEEAMFTVKQRNRPDDYDINANAEIKKLLEDVLGENGGETIFEKLEYLKSCIDTMLKPTPIKLMREAYGKNTTLKEFCEFIASQSSIAFKTQFLRELKYSDIDGYEIQSLYAQEYPNGNTSGYIGNGIYIAQKTTVLPKIACELPVIASGNVISSGYRVGDIEIVDLRNLEFGTDNIDELVERAFQLRFKIVCQSLNGIFLPKCSQLMNYSINYTGTNYCFKNGIHLGKYINGSQVSWLWGYASKIDVSTQTITPVFCDDDFYISGTLFLEKLNIPSECILEIMKKAHPYIEGTTQPILSVGSHNLTRFFENVDDAAFDECSNILEDQNDGLITIDQAYERIKEISEIFSIYFEFIKMKGWILQG